MEDQILSRKKLESLTNQELIELADEYGLDIPVNLNRNFIIAELLEYVQELETSSLSDNELNYVEYDGEKEEEDAGDALPKSYNETKINAILRDPAWVYAFWDISTLDLQAFDEDESFSNLYLHVSFFDSEEGETVSDSMDIKVSLNDRNQYVLLSSSKKHFILSLEAAYTGKANIVLARTKMISVPVGNQALKEAVPGKNMDFPPLLKLSGIDHALRLHYLNHREMFTESSS